MHRWPYSFHRKITNWMCGANKYLAVPPIFFSAKRDHSPTPCFLLAQALKVCKWIGFITKESCYWKHFFFFASYIFSCWSELAFPVKLLHWCLCSIAPLSLIKARLSVLPLLFLSLCFISLHLCWSRSGIGFILGGLWLSVSLCLSPKSSCLPFSVS